MSALVTYSLESSIITADSMTARGYNPKAVRYSRYKFKFADGVLIALSAVCLFYVIFAKASDRITFVIDPRIYSKTFDVSAFLLFLLLSFLPLITDLTEEFFMENIICEKLNFSYPTSTHSVLNDVDFTVSGGEFCLVIGRSGAGKSTLLKLMKKEIAPHGTLTGSIKINGNVGYVAQNVEENIVTDKVRSELSFGLTNMGLSRETIELSVAETASYFNLSDKLDNDISTLSGGEKQLLNLASVMITKPEILVLDEPTCQLDPVSAQRFVAVVKRLNRDFGTTVVISEHLTEELLPYADSVMIVENGEVILKDTPQNAVSFLKQSHNLLLGEIPLFMRLFDDANSVSQCREVLKNKDLPLLCTESEDVKTALRLKNISFAYIKNHDVLKSLDLRVYKGKINVLLGANSSGKTTAFKVAAGVLKAHHGKVKTDGKVSMLCQNPFDLFTKERCEDEVEFGKTTEFFAD